MKPLVSSAEVDLEVEPFERLQDGLTCLGQVVAELRVGVDAPSQRNHIWQHHLVPRPAARRSASSMRPLPILPDSEYRRLPSIAHARARTRHRRPRIGFGPIRVRSRVSQRMLAGAESPAVLHHDRTDRTPGCSGRPCDRRPQSRCDGRPACSSVGDHVTWPDISSNFIPTGPLTSSYRWVRSPSASSTFTWYSNLPFGYRDGEGSKRCSGAEFSIWTVPVVAGSLRVFAIRGNDPEPARDLRA